MKQEAVYIVGVGMTPFGGGLYGIEEAIACVTILEAASA